MTTMSFKTFIQKIWGKRWFSAILFVALLIALMSLYFVWSTISDLGPRDSLGQSVDLPTLESFSWEQDGLIDKGDMEILFPFLEMTSPFDIWWAEVQSEGILLPVSDIRFDGKKLYQIMAPQNFTFYRINQCKQNFCYQRRLTFEQIPPNLWRGLMGVEDERFLSHVGVDFFAILRALWADIKSLSLAQGGSTLTQQIVKNLYLGGEKSFLRKLKEVIISIYLETRYSKEEILLTYFNEVYWGSLAGIRINGLFSASAHYFGKRPEHLEDYEMCILVAMLKGPSLYSPLRNPTKLRERSDLVFHKLQNDDFIAKFENPIWNDKQWDKWIKIIEERNTDLHLRTLSQNLRLPFEVAGNFYEQYSFSYQAEKKLRLIQTELATKKLNVDFAFKVFFRDLLCPADGNCHQDFFYYSKLERDFEQALNSERHQVGSILKPIIYRIFVGLGKELSDGVDTSPITLKLTSGKWTPKESVRSSTQLPMQITLTEALQKSRNIPTVRVANELGWDAVEKQLLDYVPNLIVPLNQYPSQLLGAIELTFSNVAEAFDKFIHDECVDLTDGIRSADNSALLALSDPKATTLASVLQSKIGDLSFFGKTGTSNKGNDNWFVGFDGRYLTILWFGNERKEEEKSLELSGAASAFKVYENYLLTRGRPFPVLDCAQLRTR